MNRIHLRSAFRMSPWIAILSTLVLLVGGCSSSTGVDETEGFVESTAVPSLETLQKAGGLSSEQVKNLTVSHDAWQRAERAGTWDDDHSPALAFLASAAAHVSREQLRAMLGAIVSHREQHRGTMAGRGGERHGWAGRGGHGPGRGPGHGPGDGPFASLRLSDEQLAQLREARRTMHRNVMELRRSLAEGAITEAQFRAQWAEARAEFAAAMQEILTDEQLARLEALRRERMITRLTHRLDGLDDRVTRRVGLLRPILELDEAQAETLSALWMGAGPTLETILNGLQDGSMGVDEARQQLGELRRSTHDAVLEILSQEQAQLFEQLMRACHRGGRRGTGF